jgi:hypothetical protein
LSQIAAECPAPKNVSSIRTNICLAIDHSFVATYIYLYVRIMHLYILKPEILYLPINRSSDLPEIQRNPPQVLITVPKWLSM